METAPDTFTRADRRELIQQSIQLSNLTGDFSELKRSIEKQLDRDDIETRLRKLEDYRLEIKSQIRTASWLIGLVGTTIISLVEVALHIFIKNI